MGQELPNIRRIVFERLPGVGVVKVLGAGAGFVMQIVLARLLGVDAFGSYSFAWSVIVVTSLISRFGFDSYATRHIPEYIAKERWIRLRSLLFESILVPSVSAVVLGGIVLGILVVSDRSAELVTVPLAVVSASVVVLRTAYFVNEGILRGFKKPSVAPIPRMLIVRVGVIVGVVTTVALGYQLSAATAMFITAVAGILAVCVGLLLVRDNIPDSVLEVSAELTPRRSAAQATPFLLFAGIGTLRQKTDRILLGALSGSEAVGLYEPSARLAALTIFSLGVVNLTISPFVADLYSRKSYTKLQRLLSAGALITGASAVLIGCVLYYGDTFFLSIFGADYVGGSDALAILVVGNVASALAGPAAYLLMMTNQQSTAWRIDAVSAVGNLVLNIILIPPFDIAGAAVATACTLLGRNIAMAYLAVTRVGLNPTLFDKEVLNILKRYTSLS